MNPLSESLQRLVTEIDGWLDLRCPDRALERLDTLLAEPRTRSIALTLRIRAYVGQKRHKEAVADITELRAFAAVGKKGDPAAEWCRTQMAAEVGGMEPLADWLDLTEAWCRKRMRDLPAAVHCMEQLLSRNGRSGIGHFNLGCYLALAGESERALDEVTVACGINHAFRDMLHDEPDLDSLRDDKRFQALMTGNPRTGKPKTDPAEAAAEADAFEDDMAEGFEEDLEFDDDEEGDGEFDEDFDDDEDEEDEEDDEDETPPRGRADGSRP